MLSSGAKIAAALCLVLVLILLYTALPPTRYDVVGGGHRRWHVVADYNNKQAAAAMLDRVNARMVELMRVLKKKYHIDETDDVAAAEGSAHTAVVGAPNDLYAVVDHMLSGYDPDSFYENDPRHSRDTSYTVGKGQAMYVCLRDKQDPTRLVDEDVLFFVMLHEASHIANYRGWGHIQAFWETFKFMLHEAQLAGLYTPADYAARPVMYCGLLINYQPLLDANVRALWL